MHRPAAGPCNQGALVYTRPHVACPVGSLPAASPHRREPGPGDRPQPHEVRRRLLRRDGAARCRRPSRPWTRWRRAPSPTPTRSAWSGHYWLRAPELRARRRSSRRAIERHARADPQRSPPTCTPARIAPRDGRALHAAAGHRHRRLGAGAAVRRATRWAAPARQDARRSSSTTPIPTAWTACWRSSATSSPRRSRVVISQVRRHQGDAQRHARGRSAPTQARASTSRKHAVAVTGDGSELDKYAAARRLARALSRCGTGSAGAPRSCPRWACCRRRCRASTSTRMLAGARDMDEATRAARRAQEPGRAARADVVPRRQRARRRRTWSSCRTRIG